MILFKHGFNSQNGENAEMPDFYFFNFNLHFYFFYFILEITLSLTSLKFQGCATETDKKTQLGAPY